MKKLLTMIAVVLMMSLCMTVIAFAEETDDPTNQEVYGSYADGQEADATISVDISWGDMTFVYQDTQMGTWDDVAHDYVGTVEAHWEPVGSNKITVENDSNVGIKATFTFTPAEDTEFAGTFQAADTSATKTEITLEAATTERAPSDNVFFVVTDGTLEAGDEDVLLGNITVEISTIAE